MHLQTPPDPLRKESNSWLTSSQIGMALLKTILALPGPLFRSVHQTITQLTIFCRRLRTPLVGNPCFIPAWTPEHPERLVSLRRTSRAERIDQLESYLALP